jgi:hypothetical protein
MANNSKGVWYVSFELPREGKRSFARSTETFPTEREAKQFARERLLDMVSISAGTLSPHLPRRAIAPTQVAAWIEEPDKPI